MAQCKQRTKNRIWRLAAILFILAAGCSSDTDPSPSNGLPQAAPPAITGARLLFHRPDGLYLMTLGQPESQNLHPHGRYGRWAPDGRSFAFLAQDQIFWQDLHTGNAQPLTTVRKPGAITFHPDGNQILFTDGDAIRSVRRDTRQVQTILTGPAFLELDVATDGSFLATTVRRFGYRVMRWELPDGNAHDFGRGCSAGISPDDRWITINAQDHLSLTLHDSRSGQASRQLPAPAGYPLDNQKWSNHQDWIAGIVEEPAQDIIVQFVPDGSVWRVTDVGDADRPDIFMPPDI